MKQNIYAYKEAFRSLEKYSKSQLIVFDFLIEEAEDFIFYFSPKRINEITKISKPTIYGIIKTFKNDGVIVNLEKIGIYKFKEETLNIILQLHLKRVRKETKSTKQ